MFGLSAALYFRCTKTGSGGKFCVVSHSLMCGSLTLGGHVPLRGSGNLGTWVQEFVAEDINHHALRRVRQWSQFLLDSITTFNFSTGVLGRSLGYTLTTGRYS